VDNAYRDLPFPFAEIPAPPFTIVEQWTLDRFLGYLRTWSAVRRYQQATGTDPLSLVEGDLRAAWGGEARMVRWPLALRAGNAN
jgi:hypothetical protein